MYKSADYNVVFLLCIYEYACLKYSISYVKLMCIPLCLMISVSQDVFNVGMLVDCIFILLQIMWIKSLKSITKLLKSRSYFIMLFFWLNIHYSSSYYKIATKGSKVERTLLSYKFRKLKQHKIYNFFIDEDFINFYSLHLHIDFYLHSYVTIPAENGTSASHQPVIQDISIM